jgi:hypothetical protein
MKKKLLAELIRMQGELPQLQYDFQNASTTFALQAACQRMFNITSYLTHFTTDLALEILKERQGPSATAEFTKPKEEIQAPPAAPALGPATQPVRVLSPIHTTPEANDELPPSITQTSLGDPTPVASAQSVEASIQGKPGETSVFIGSQGTVVIPPSGRKIELPAGTTEIPLSVTQG